MSARVPEPYLSAWRALLNAHASMVGRIEEADEISVGIVESTDTPQAMEMHCAAVLDLLDARLLAGDLDGAAPAIERARFIDTFHGTMAWHQQQRYATLQARFALATGDRERASSAEQAVLHRWLLENITG